MGKVLHIGMRKSGSTWLQESIRNAEPHLPVHLHMEDLKKFVRRNKWQNLSDAQFKTLGDIFSAAPENSLITTETLVFMDLQKLARTAFETVPDAQIVLIVRNPAAWLKSQYTHVIMNGRFLDQKHAAEQMLTARFVRMFDIQAYLDAFTT